MLLEKELKLVTVEGQRGFLYQKLQRGFSARTICQQPPLYSRPTTPIVGKQHSQLTVVVFGRLTGEKQRSTSLETFYSITPSSCSSPSTPPFFVNFMDLSANGLPPHCPSHIWHPWPAQACHSL